MTDSNKSRVNAIGSTWEQFKQVNDRRLKEIERKGNADSLTTGQLNRINNALDEYKSRVETVETAMSRPEYGFAVDSIEHDEHKAAFKNYLRKGEDSNLALIEQKALSVGSDADGGYLVTSSMSDQIVSRIFESSPMRQLANVQEISSDALEVVQAHTELQSGWTSEAGAVTDTTTPTLAKSTIEVHELYAQPKATQKLIDDSSVDIEAWLVEKIADSVGRMENAAFINGDGVGKPTGILNYTAGTNWGEIEQISSTDAGNVTADSLVELFYSLQEGYATHAHFLMNRATAQQVRLLKESSTGQYIWQPGLAAGAADTLLGVPVMQAADMPAPSADSLSVAVGDFSRAYQIVDRTGVRVLRDPFTEKPFVKFYATKRVGGEVVNFDAVKLLRLSA